MPRRRRRKLVASSRGSESPCSRCMLRMADKYNFIDYGLSVYAK